MSEDCSGQVIACDANPHSINATIFCDVGQSQ
jgi:hypothetical protein